MGELKSNNRVEEKLDQICCLLSRSVVLQKDAIDQEKQSGETTVSLLRPAGTNGDLAKQRSGLVQERTSLVCAETHSSTRSTELPEIGTDLARERRNLAVERTDFAALRTEATPDRTSPSEQNVYMAEMRTCLAEKRNMQAISRTIYCKTRTELARGRTYLALIRTGLAFFTIAIFLFRQFGVSWWTAFDASIAAASVAATVVGLIGYKRTMHATKHLDVMAAEHEACQSDFRMLKA
ncbi:MAG: DUF202 domain-containing protein [Deltaproteobacteria bacterium]